MGRLGHIAVAALSVSGVILSVIMMVAIGISSGATALIAHFTGKRIILMQTECSSRLCISFISSAVMVLVGIFGTEEITAYIWSN